VVEGRWIAPQRETVTVFRDNPPLTGFVRIHPYSITGSPPATVPRTSPVASSFVWSGTEYRFGGSFGHTFHDERNAEGYLGLSHVGSAPRPGTIEIRYHSNGLQLTPGNPVHLQLQQRERSRAWVDVPGVQGNVVLDPSTRIVGVSVIVVREPNDPAPATTEALAQMWFDGREVDRVQTSISSGGALNAFISDQLPRPAWTEAAFDNPSEGHRADAFRQEVDSVWCYCGRFGRNIQFRLVRFVAIDRTRITGVAEGINMIQSPRDRERWVRNVVAAAVPKGGPPSIPVIVVKEYTVGLEGPGQAWPDGIVIGENLYTDIGRLNRQNGLAHELGHVLGFDAAGNLDPSFYDLTSGPPNLMRDSSGILTERQAQVAYNNAARYLVR
jgi:hypothetical protein